jgi:opacity protein-like surface antigen
LDETSLCASTAALALVTASALPAPAIAADLILHRSTNTVHATWAGSYVGIAGGGAWGGATLRNSVTGADQTPRFDLGGASSASPSGFNLQGANGVVGFEADIRP